jgi:hypothetical protein
MGKQEILKSKAVMGRCAEPGAANVVSICHEQRSGDGILSVYTKSGRRTTKELLKALPLKGFEAVRAD